MGNSLKILAQKAKKRLREAGQTITKKEEKPTNVYLSQHDYAIVVSRQNIEEDPLYEKVRKVMQKGDIINPLAELTDYDIFNKLSSAEKEKYMIDISKRYNKIREYVASHNLD
ncbi:MAG: hypothetical protein IJX17_02730 [Clostridia bacterium]|nr:hypothetical protein [Clostridia bacterium]